MIGENGCRQLDPQALREIVEASAPSVLGLPLCLANGSVVSFSLDLC